METYLNSNPDGTNSQNAIAQATQSADRNKISEDGHLLVKQDPKIQFSKQTFILDNSHHINGLDTFSP